jgi:hypothetical protein
MAALPLVGSARVRLARSRMLSGAELAASIDGLVPAGAPIMPTARWSSGTCAGCGREVASCGDVGGALLMRWSNWHGAELRGGLGEGCASQVQALASVWTGSGALGARMVYLSAAS